MAGPLLQRAGRLMTSVPSQRRRAVRRLGGGGAAAAVAPECRHAPRASGAPRAARRARCRGPAPTIAPSASAGTLRSAIVDAFAGARGLHLGVGPEVLAHRGLRARAGRRRGWRAAAPARPWPASAAWSSAAAVHRARACSAGADEQRAQRRRQRRPTRAGPARPARRRRRSCAARAARSSGHQACQRASSDSSHFIAPPPPAPAAGRLRCGRCSRARTAWRRAR